MLRMFSVILGTAALLTVLLTLVYLLPTDRIEENVRISARVYEKEGSHPVLSESYTSYLDNYTDILLLLEAAGPRSGNPLRDAMEIPSGSFPYVAPPAAMQRHFIEGIPYSTIFTYARYWQAHMLVLKPLLMFMTIREIRILNLVIQSLLVLLIVFMLYRAGMSLFILPWLLTVGMLVPTTLWRCIQYSFCYYSAMIGTLGVLYLKDKKYRFRYEYLFLAVGILTAVTDQMSYPALALGIPAVVCLGVTDRRDSRLVWGRLIRISLSWVTGYAGIWACKWILGSLVLEESIVRDAYQAILLRTSSGRGGSNSETFTVSAVSRKLWRLFLTNPVRHAADFYLRAAIIVTVFLLALFFIRCGKARNMAVQIFRTVLPALAVSVLPFAWCAFALNHSGVHWFFTNKLMAVFIFAILCIPSMLLQDLKTMCREYR